MTTLGATTIYGGEDIDQSDISSDDEDPEELKQALDQDMEHAFDDLDLTIAEPMVPTQLGTISPIEGSHGNPYKQGFDPHPHSPSPWSDNGDMSGNFPEIDPIEDNLPIVPIQIDNHSIENIHCYGQNGMGQANFLSEDTSEGRLQHLYEIRGEELDKLQQEQQESKHEIMQLKQHIASIKSEKEMLSIKSKQMEILLDEKEARLRECTSTLKSHETKLSKLETENERLKKTLEASESTVANLEQFVAELQTNNNLAKSRQLHEDFVGKLRISHKQEIQDLKMKCAESSARAERYEQQVTRMKSDLASAKKDYESNHQNSQAQIQLLQVEIETYKRQCEELLKEGRGEISEDMEDFRQENKDLRQRLKSSENLEKLARDELKTLDMIIKLGLLKSVMPNDDSLVQFGVCKALDFDDSGTGGETTKEKTKTQTPINNEELEAITPKLLKVVLVNKKYREEIIKLQERSYSKQQELAKVKSRLKSVEIDKEQSRTSANLSRMSMESVEKMTEAQIQEENIALMKELKTLRKQMVVVDKIHDIIHKQKKFQDLDPSTVALLEGLSSRLNGMVQLHQRNSQDDMKNVAQIKASKFLNVVEINKLHNRLNQMAADLTSNAPCEADTVCMRTLLNDFVNWSGSFKQEMAVLLTENIQFRKSLLQHERTIDVQNAEKEQLKKHLEKLEKETTEKGTVLERNYMEFHEKSVAKLRHQFEQDLKDMRHKHESRIEEMTKELTSVKESFVALSEEKNFLEHELEKLQKELENNLEKEKQIVDEKLEESSPNHDDSLHRKYEDQIRELKAKYQKVLEEKLALARANPAHEIDTLKATISQLTNALAKIKNEKLQLHQHHEKDVKQITEKLLDSESQCKELQNQLEASNCTLSEIIHEFTVEKSELNNQIEAANERVASAKNKHNKCLQKYLKLEASCQKYQKLAEERIQRYKERIELVSNHMDDHVERFKKYLTKSKNIYIDMIDRSVSQLKKIPFPNFSLKCAIEDLQEIEKALGRLDVKFVSQ